MFAATAAAGCLWLTLGAAPSDFFPINQPNFQIPIRIDPGRRGEIKQLILYASTDQGKTWEQQQVTGPEKDAFVFTARSDGMYWFNVCVVDNRGHCEPADVSKVPPAQKILVDTVRPLVRIVSAERQGDEIAVEWDIREEHPDLATLKLEYRSGEMTIGQWLPIPLSPAMTGKTRFRVQGSAPVSLRMQIMDLAGNSGTAAADVPGANRSTSASLSSSWPASSPTGSSVAAGPALNAVADSSRPIPPPMPPRPELSPPPDSSTAGLGSAVQQATLASSPPNRLLASSEVHAATPPSAASMPPSGGSGSPSAPVQIVNSKRIPIDYQATRVGPSGLGQVDLWITDDDGRTWRLYSHDTQLQRPMIVDLPGEGTFGLRLVARSRAGRGKPPPLAGDSPDMRVEVDTTPPSAKLFQPEADPERPNEALVISWSATDKNLDATPISLHWAERSDGPWQPIAENLRNDGHYSWLVPKRLPDSNRVFLKLTARDRAGNVSEAITQEPILVDLVEAEVKITGIAGARR